MANNGAYTIYGKDERGNFTVYLGETYASSYLSTEDVKELNSESHIRTYTIPYYEVHDLSTSDYQYGRFRDPNWRMREEGKFSSNVYEAPPWNLAPIKGHFAHISIEKDTMIAFTPDELKGMMDIQIRMKPGRYLAKFYPQLDSDTVRALACELDKANEVRFATTADEIEHVYVNGPTSCMSGEASDYASPFHPVRVYAAGDLSLAYLSALEADHDDFRASSRCLVWPAHKVHGRIYGDDQRMGAALLALGYKPGRLNGARVLKCAYKNGYVLPYIDGAQSVGDEDDHFTIGGGDIEAGSTNGLSSEIEQAFCPRLDDYVDEDESEFTFVRDVREHWSTRAIELFAQRCDATYDYYSDDACMIEMANGETWCERYFSDHGATCARTEECFPASEVVTLVDTDETVSADWATSNAFCDDDGDWYAEKPSDDADETPSAPLHYFSTSPDQLALPLTAVASS